MQLDLNLRVIKLVQIIRHLEEQFVEGSDLVHSQSFSIFSLLLGCKVERAFVIILYSVR